MWSSGKFLLFMVVAIDASRICSFSMDCTDYNISSSTWFQTKSFEKKLIHHDERSPALTSPPSGSRQGGRRWHAGMKQRIALGAGNYPPLDQSN